MRLLTSVTDPLLRTETYDYDTGNGFFLKTITHADSGVETRTANASGQIASRTLPVGEVIHYGYDARGYPAYVDRGNGLMSLTVYDDRGNLLASRGEDGVGTRCVYRTDGLPTTCTSDRTGAAQATQHAYDLMGNEVQTIVTGADGATATTVTSLQVTDVGGAYAASSMTDGYQTPVASTQAWGYDPVGRLVKSTDPLSRATTYQPTYSTDGTSVQVTKSMDAMGTAATTQTTTQTMDVTGSVVVAVDEAGSTTTSAYSAKTGRLMTQTLGAAAVVDGAVTNPAVNVTYTYAYNPGGTTQAATGPDGQTTTYTYNNVDRVTQTSDTDASGNLMVTTSTYDLDGRVVTSTVQRSSDPAAEETTTYTYDTSGRAVSVKRVGTDGKTTVVLKNYPSPPVALTYSVSSGGAVGAACFTDGDCASTLRCDQTLAAGHCQQAGSGASGATCQTTTDCQRGLSCLTVSGASTCQIDLLGLSSLADTISISGVNYAAPVSETDANGVVERLFVHDGLGRLAESNEQGNAFDYTYDSHGCLVQQTGGGRTVTYTCDTLGRRISETMNGLTKSWTYNTDGTVATFTDYDQRTTTYGYDALGRIQTVAYGAATATSPSAGTVTYTYYQPSGLLQQMTDLSGTTSYEYNDALNRLTKRSWVDAEDPTQTPVVVTYTYVPGSARLQSITYWDQGTVTYQYDGLDRVTQLTTWGNTPYAFSYSGAGKVTEVDVGQNASVLKTLLSYDSLDRLSGIHASSGPGAVFGIDYTSYDNEGNLLTQVDTYQGVSYATTYTYDNVHRLTSAALPDLSAISGPAATTQTFVYDATGNATTFRATATPFTYDTSDRITTSGYQYDTNGNLTRKGQGGNCLVCAP